MADYDRWTQEQDRDDEVAECTHRKLAIEQGDPECETVIAALEAGWTLRCQERS